MSQPFIEEVKTLRAGCVRARSVFSPSSEILQDHQLDGIPLVPAAVLLEMCVATAAWTRGWGNVINIANFQVSTGVRFYDEEALTLFTEAVWHEDGPIQCRITGNYVDRRTGQADSEREYARATFLEGAGALITNPKPTFPTEFESLGTTKPAPYDPLHEGTVAHGPAWGALAGFSPADTHCAWFRLELDRLPQPVRMRLQKEKTVSAVMDAVLQACDVFCRRTRGTSQLPAGIQKLSLQPAHMRNSPLWVFVTESEHNERESLFDAWTWDSAGETALVAQGIQLLRRRPR